MRDGKINQGWIELFNHYDILEKIYKYGYYKISAKEINTFPYSDGKREARLMTKFDTLEELPIVFYENNITILPIKNGEYILGNFYAYHKLNYNPSIYKEMKYYTLPKWIKTINPDKITSENIAINLAEISGAFYDFFKTEPDEFKQTVNGKQRSPDFNYYIQRKDRTPMLITAKKPQIEIDAGYETPKNLILLEAKNKNNKSFNIRQLYYPFKSYAEKTNKIIIPTYLECNNNIFTLRQFVFEDINNYNSIIEIQKSHFIIKNNIINTQEIDELLKNNPQKYYTDIPFPQANSLYTVLDLFVEINNQKKVDKHYLSTQFDLDKRQIDYYLNAIKFLGYIDENNNITKKGINLAKQTPQNQYKDLIKTILSIPIFHIIFKQAYVNDIKLNKKDVFKISETITDDNNLNELNQTTKLRRCDTIASWINTIIDFINN